MLASEGGVAGCGETLTLFLAGLVLCCSNSSNLKVQQVVKSHHGANLSASAGCYWDTLDVLEQRSRQQRTFGSCTISFISNLRKHLLLVVLFLKSRFIPQLFQATFNIEVIRFKLLQETFALQQNRTVYVNYHLTRAFFSNADSLQISNAFTWMVKMLRLCEFS